MYETKPFDNPAESSEKDKTYMTREPRTAVQNHECAAGIVPFRNSSRRAPGPPPNNAPGIFRPDVFSDYQNKVSENLPPGAIWLLADGGGRCSGVAPYEMNHRPSKTTQMGRPKKNAEEKREPSISIKLTPSERRRLEMDMKSQDYNCIAAYVRDILFRRRTPVKRIPYTGRGIRNGINEFTTQLAKIGANYNQKVKSVNALIGAKRKNGDMVINTKYLAQYEDQSITLMEDIRRVQEEFIDHVAKSLELVERKIDLVLTAGEKVGALYESILSSKAYVKIENVRYATDIVKLIKSNVEVAKASEELLATVEEMKNQKRSFEKE